MALRCQGCGADGVARSCGWVDLNQWLRPLAAGLVLRFNVVVDIRRSDPSELGENEQYSSMRSLRKRKTFCIRDNRSPTRESACGAIKSTDPGHPCAAVEPHLPHFLAIPDQPKRRFIFRMAKRHKVWLHFTCLRPTKRTATTTCPLVCG